MNNPVLNYNLDISSDSQWLTVTASQAARSGLLYVQELGDFLCGREYYTYRKDLNSYQLILSLSGKGHLKYRDKEYEVPAGSLIYLDCTQTQYYRTAPDSDHWHTLWVHLYGANASVYHELFDQMNDGSPITYFGGDGTLKSLLLMLIKLYNVSASTINEDIRAASLLSQLLTQCLQTVNTAAGSDRAPNYVQDIRSYIELHYSERLTLDKLAAAISINKFYLQKLFKRSIGISPNEYLIYVRLNHAKQLLRTTSDSISKIASDVGINNIGHFVELFKRYEGSTPSLYRLQWYNCNDNRTE